MRTKRHGSPRRGQATQTHRPAACIAALLLALSTHAVDFPGYRGPDRSGVARADVGLADDWSALPGGKPTELWRSGDLGIIGIDHTNGQVSVWRDLVYAVTYKNGTRTIFCFDTAGTPQWDKALNAPYGGTHDENPSPWVWDGKVYIHDNAQDHCLNARTGATIWATSRQGDSKASCVIVDSVMVMREQSYFVGKDALTGAKLWARAVPDNSGSTGSAALWKTPSKIYAILPLDNNNAIMCVDPVSGDELWRVDPPGAGNDGEPNTSPLALGQYLVLTTRNLDVSQPQICYRLFPDNPSQQPVQLWANGYSTVKGSPVIHQGHAYWGYTTRHNTYALCTELESGDIEYWEQSPSGIRSCMKGYNDLLVADGKLYGTGCLQSVMAWPSPDAFDLISTFDNNANHQTTPTIVNGRMYVYSYDGYSQGGENVARIKCFDVSAPAGSAPSITQRSLPDGGLGNWYEQRLWVSGGNGLRTWSLVSGEPPPGLTLDGEQHVISGRPSSKGTYTFTVKVVDEDGDSDSKELTILVGDQQGTVAVSRAKTPMHSCGAAAAAAVLYGLNGRRVGTATADGAGTCSPSRGVYAASTTTSGFRAARLIVR